MFKALFGKITSLLSWKPRAQDPPPNSSPDDTYLQKVVNYIPADIVGAWVTISGAIAQAGTSTPHWLSWAVFGGLLALIPFYVCYLKTTPAGLTSNKLLYWITSCVAFTAWVFALGPAGPFGSLSWYEPIYGTIVLVFVTLSIPILEGLFIKNKGSGSGTGSRGSGSDPSGSNTPPKK